MYENTPFLAQPYQPRRYISHYVIHSIHLYKNVNTLFRVFFSFRIKYLQDYKYLDPSSVGSKIEFGENKKTIGEEPMDFGKMDELLIS